MEDCVEIAKLAYTGLTFQARDRLPKNGAKYSNGTTVIIDKHILAKVTIAANRARTELNEGKGPISTGFFAHSEKKFGKYAIAKEKYVNKTFGRAEYEVEDNNGLRIIPYKKPQIIREIKYNDSRGGDTYITFFKRLR